MPLVSIIMPSLNVEKYIEECLESVCKQTLSDIEIICIDSGSTDKTRYIIKQYTLLDERIRYIESSAKSYGYQVNLGIEEAKGKYIAIVETDDYVDLELYNKLYDCAQLYDADYVKADYRALLEKGAYRIYNMEHMRSNISDYNHLIDEQEFMLTFVEDSSIWGAIYKRDFLINNNIRLNETKGAAFQDIGFKMLTLLYAQRVVYLDYSGYIYRMEREGCSSCNSNVLKYAWQEFDRLLYQLDLSSNDRFKYLVLRMIDVFICEHNKLVRKQALEQQADEFYETYIEPYYVWFKGEIDRFFSEGVVSIDDLNEYQRRNLMPLLENESEYNLKLIQAEKKAVEFWDGLAARIETAQAVIVSYGARGKAALKQLIDRDINVVAICDNNAEVRKQKIGIPIMSVEKAVEQYKAAYFVISNKNYAEELKEQLLEMQAAEDRICLFHDTYGKCN